MNIVPVYDIIWLKRNDWESQNDAMPEFPANLKVQVGEHININLPLDIISAFC